MLTALSYGRGPASVPHLHAGKQEEGSIMTCSMSKPSVLAQHSGYGAVCDSLLLGISSENPEAQIT